MLVEESADGEDFVAEDLVAVAAGHATGFGEEADDPHFELLRSGGAAGGGVC